jgi:hypothetical protein
MQKAADARQHLLVTTGFFITGTVLVAAIPFKE